MTRITTNLLCGTNIKFVIIFNPASQDLTENTATHCFAERLNYSAMTHLSKTGLALAVWYHIPGEMFSCILHTEIIYIYIMYMSEHSHNTVYYNTITLIVRQWQVPDFDQIMKSQKTLHTSPSQMDCVFDCCILYTLEENDRVIKISYCIYTAQELKMYFTFWRIFWYPSPISLSLWQHRDSQTKAVSHQIKGHCIVLSCICHPDISEIP